MAQAAVDYRRNREPSRGLAATGVIIVKAVLAIPHLMIVSALEELALLVGYIGYFIVAFTGRMPEGIHTLISLWLRWATRAYGWLAGITDVYPPFETDPVGYGIDARTPRNQQPHRGWAVAGIFFVKLLAALPHLVLLALVTFVAVVATWIGYVVVLVSGRLPDGLQDFIAGTIRWWVRVMAWILGLTDEYPPFSLAISPRQ